MTQKLGRKRRGSGPPATRRALYDGTCAHCGKKVYTGQIVGFRKVADQWRVLHSECVSSFRPARASRSDAPRPDRKRGYCFAACRERGWLVLPTGDHSRWLCASCGSTEVR